MQTRVLRPGELGQAERETWDAFLRGDHSLASPFLTPEFAVAIDAVRDDARVVVVEDADAPVAFLAFSSSDDGTGADRRDDLRRASARGALGSMVIHRSWCAPRA